jgi:hypothetical protein
MANPFEKRATEYLRDDEAAFLSLVSPEPLRTYLESHAAKGKLFDLLVRIVGSPGSGKTTMATLLEARMVDIVLADKDKEDYREIIKALEVCGVVESGCPIVAAVRLPMEGEYRDFWELPYDEALRTKLLLAIVQARAVLGLVRNLERRRSRSAISFVVRGDASAALETIGGHSTEAILQRARAVERAVYEVGASLVPLREGAIPEAAVKPFRPFDVIEGVRVSEPDGRQLTLKPLIILDDAHNLAPQQFRAIFRDLARREIRVARWIMMRLDGLSPAAVLTEGSDDLAPELKTGRDYIDVFLQQTEERGRTRSAFRGVAQSMADRYLRRHRLFEQRQYRGFATLLSTEPDRLPVRSLEKCRREVDQLQVRLNVSHQRRASIEREIDQYTAGAQSTDVGPDVQCAMVRILLSRYAKRVPQQSLFGRDDPEPRHGLTADSGVAEGARLYLKQEYGRALHYGLPAISDASSENAELFLHLAAALVDRMEARIINGDPPLLSARQQDGILSERARRIIERWNFPFASRVRAMVGAMASECLQESLKPNAPLDAGANAIGIQQGEFETIARENPDLAQVLHYALAYTAITLRTNYKQGGHAKRWCLLQLGGPVVLTHGLTLKRGGFLERRVADLIRYAELG